VARAARRPRECECTLRRTFLIEFVRCSRDERAPSFASKMSVAAVAAAPDAARDCNGESGAGGAGAGSADDGVCNEDGFAPIFVQSPGGA
jgi:hypothetical protein